MATGFEDSGAGPGPDFMTDDERRLAERHRADHERQKQALYLQRENILSQKTSHPARRTALAAALAQVEAQIASLG